MQFRLSTLFWVTLVVATSMGLAGVWGVPCAVYWIALLWAAARPTGKPWPAKVFYEVLGITVIVGCLTGLLLPLRSQAGPAARRSQCANNLKYIGVALHAYHDKWKSLPPAVVCDAAGTPLHSWRTLILTHIEHADLYSAFDLNTPWNAGKNAPLPVRRPSMYLCASEYIGQTPNNTDTSYFAVVGPDTVWDDKAQSPTSSPAAERPGEAESQGDMRIAVIEVSQSGIVWSEPKDLTIDEVLDATDNKDPKIALPRSEHPGGFQVLLANGTVRWLPSPLPRTLMEMLLTRGFTAEAEQEVKIVCGRTPFDERGNPKTRAFGVVALTFVVWLASVIGFGVHAWRVRRPARGPATDKADEPTPLLPPPSECDHDAKRGDITGSSAVDVGEEKRIAGRASDVPGA